jgi:hypothetical protein
MKNSNTEKTQEIPECESERTVVYPLWGFCFGGAGPEFGQPSLVVITLPPDDEALCPKS